MTSHVPEWKKSWNPLNRLSLLAARNTVSP